VSNAHERVLVTNKNVWFSHIDIKQYFVRELVLAGFLKLVPQALLTNKVVADALSKGAPSPGPAFVGH